MFLVLVPLPTLVGEVYVQMGGHEGGHDGISRFRILSGLEVPFPSFRLYDALHPRQWGQHY